MGQKTHPIGFRLTINRDWKSSWFVKKNFQKHLQEDMAIRKTVSSMFRNVVIPKIRIERMARRVRIIIATTTPRAFLGNKGSDIEKLNKKILEIIPDVKVGIKIEDIKTPESNAYAIASHIAYHMTNRSSKPYRKIMKRILGSAMMSGAKGIKVVCSGRISGAEIARDEKYMHGCVPLHTMRANIDYASIPARTTYGIIGIKVWIYKGYYKEQTINK